MQVESGLREKLKQLNEIGIALSQERNLVRLLDMILEQACRFTDAEAGTLYTIRPEGLVFEVAHNEALGVEDRLIGAPPVPLSRTSLAGYCALTGKLLNIPDAYDLSEDVPYLFNDSYDAANNYRTRSVLMVPMREPTGETIGVLQLINARNADGETVPFDADHADLVMSLASQAAVSMRNVRLTTELKDSYLDTILRLSRAAEYRDTDTGEHIRRMALYSQAIALELGMPEAEAEQLLYAAPMHDIGKIAIPDAILQKPGRFTPEEYEAMKQHTVIGAEILDGALPPVLKLSREIALTHHERWDGTGYPNGLAGRDIPIHGRIVSLADVFDALTSKRCYKDAFPVERALTIIRENSGSQFDPEVVEAFFRVLPTILEIRERHTKPTDPTPET